MNGPVEVTKGSADDEELAAVAMALDMVAARRTSSEPAAVSKWRVIASRRFAEPPPRMALPRLGEDFAGEGELGSLVEGTAALVLVEVVHLDPLRAGVRVVGRKHRRRRTDRVA